MDKKRQNLMRIKKEVEFLKKEIYSKEISCIEILHVDPDFKNAIICFSGPLDSPYEGYWFRVEIQWPHGYPFVPPKCKLVDPIWNPFVDFHQKKICMDILRDQHCPALTVFHHVLSIISLLSQTKIGHINQGFMNAEAAIQMMKNYPIFFKHAKQLCQASSYKKQQIYTDDMRGFQQEHQILAQQDEVEELKTQNKSSKKYNKSKKERIKRKQIRKRQLMKMRQDLERRREKYRQLKKQYGYENQKNQAEIDLEVRNKADIVVNDQKSEQKQEEQNNGEK